MSDDDVRLMVNTEPTEIQVAAYIRDTTSELTTLARTRGRRFEDLVYLLRMATLEATQLGRAKPGDTE